MLSALKNHPFPIEAYFRTSVVITFAVNPGNISHLIPQCLEPDTFNNEHAFIAAALVDTKNLRPKGFPTVFGNDFILIGYRVFVRFTNGLGKKRRGLYILKSETNKRKMELLGNIFTHYNYSTTDILWNSLDGIVEIKSNNSGIRLRYEEGEQEVPLPTGSPFSDWREARKFAGPLPFTFTYNEKNKSVLIIEGVREGWVPGPIKVLEYKFAFLDNLNLGELRLANAFVIRNIPYYWKAGKLEQWWP